MNITLDTTSVIQCITLIILLILSAFFSSAETALTTLNKVRVRTLVEEKNKRAVILQQILDKPSKMLNSILIGNNIVNLSASAIATTMAMTLFGNAAVSIATGIVTMMVILFGEIVPKTWASLNSEKIALTYAPIIVLLIKLLTPLIYIVDKLSNAILFIFSIDKNAKNAMTESELRTLVDVSHEDGVIESDEREMIYNVFDFSDSLAKDIMIPRIDMTSVSVEATYQEVIHIFKESMYTRLPVFENDSDNVIGIVNVKDFILVEQQDAFHISDIMREGYYTYEFKKTADLLMEMRETTAGMAMVLNEYGATVGLVTLEDLLEEIVGEIRDEYDEDEELFIQEIGDNEYLIEGGMKLDDINDALDTSLDSEDYDSIGGIIIELLDRLPDKGDTVTTDDGIILTVEEIEQNRVEKVRMLLPEEADLEEEEHTDAEALSVEIDKTGIKDDTGSDNDSIS